MRSMLTVPAALVPRCKQPEPTSGSPHLTCAQQYGSHLQGRCDTRYVVLDSSCRRRQPIRTKHEKADPPVCPSGADSRTTTGAYIANRVTDKLTRVHDTIWCCRSGSAADTQAVADIVQYQLGQFHMMNGKTPTTQTAAAMFQELCYANKDMLT